MPDNEAKVSVSNIWNNSKKYLFYVKFETPT